MLYDGRPDAGQKSDAYVTSHAAQDFDRTYLSTLLLPRIISSSLQAHLPTSALSLPHTHVSSLSKHGTDSSAWLSFDELRTAPYLALGVARCAACCSAFTLAWSWCHDGRCTARRPQQQTCCSCFHVRQPRPSSSCSVCPARCLARSSCPQASRGEGRGR
jgi:hypothetical protein